LPLPSPWRPAAPWAPLTLRAVAAAAALPKNRSGWSERYVPTQAELVLSRELGVGEQAVMLVAVQRPGLAALDAEAQVRPAVRDLLAAGVDKQEAWFILSKRQALMEEPIVTQRWLDFLGQYGLRTKQITSFLLQAPPDFFKARARRHCRRCPAFPIVGPRAEASSRPLRPPPH